MQKFIKTQQQQKKYVFKFSMKIMHFMYRSQNICFLNLISFLAVVHNNFQKYSLDLMVKQSTVQD